MTINVCMMISSTMHMHTGMRNKQLKVDEEDRKRLAEDEREWKFWIAFWNKVCFDVVFASAHVKLHFMHCKTLISWHTSGVQQSPGKEQKRVQKAGKKATSVRLRVTEARGMLRCLSPKP